ncbi:MAG: methionine aminotransferase [Ignavibacteriaceae bacterium]
MPNIKSKLPYTGTSIFTTMSKMALEYNAINLSQGFPDFDGPEELFRLFKHYLDSGYNQYAPMQGVPQLRYKLSEKIEQLYSRKYNPDTEILVTAGATQAVFTAITCAINKGDEVILMEPAYDSYAPSVIVNGGIPVFVPLNQDNYSIQWELVKNAVTAKTRMIIINSPHNPTGSVINDADIRILEEITRDSNILIVSDEVYEHIVFDNEKHISIAGSAELSERSFVISSFGKTYHTTGWKLGYCAAPENLMNEFKKVHQFIVFSINTPAQYAFADFLDNKEHYLTLNKFYQGKRDLMLKHLRDSGFSFIPAKGTYFQLLDYSDISQMTDTDFSNYLTKEKGVAVIPLSPFYSSSYSGKIIRLCFAKKDEVLVEAAERLRKL